MVDFDFLLPVELSETELILPKLGKHYSLTSARGKNKLQKPVEPPVTCGDVTQRILASLIPDNNSSPLQVSPHSHLDLPSTDLTMNELEDKLRLELKALDLFDDVFFLFFFFILFNSLKWEVRPRRNLISPMMKFQQK